MKNKTDRRARGQIQIKNEILKNLEKSSLVMSRKNQSKMTTAGNYTVVSPFEGQNQGGCVLKRKLRQFLGECGTSQRTKTVCLCDGFN